MAKKNYTDSEKREILKKAEETSVSAASKEYGVARTTIINWRADEKLTAGAIETKKTVRAAGRKAKAAVKETAKTAKKTVKKAAEEVKETVEAAAEVAADQAAAETIETRKKVRGAGRKAKATVEKAAEAVAEKADEIKLADEMTAGRVKAKRTRKKAEKQEEKAVKAVEKKEAAEEKAAEKPAAKRKALKMNLVFQSQAGGAITPEQIAVKLPKDTTDCYVKLEENKAYYVLKDGSTGSVDLW